jgi:NAD(P)-dependent dehydrogenase (short-subunit alcohol dehydrogenase family)
MDEKKLLREAVAMPDKTQRVALITGANRGIGFEAAQQLIRRRFHVVLTARDEASGDRAARSVDAGDGSVAFLAIDVSSSDSIRQAANRFQRISDHLDVLINNAGIYPEEGLNILTVPRNQMVETLQTNALGPLEMTQAFLSYLRKAAAPRVINISSGYGQLGGLSSDVPSYCLSKLALNGLTIMLAEALKPDGIAVNSMCPGWVRTDMGGPNATLSIGEGADTAVWLADEASQELTGKFFRNRKEISW